MDEKRNNFICKISIIIPAFNEAGAVGKVVAALRKQFKDIDIIVVDDGSDDATAEIAAANGARVVQHVRNLGYGAALRSGIEASDREYVLFCDADGQHRIEDVEKLIETAASTNYDMIVGARTKESHNSWIRRPGKWILKIFANYLAGQSIPDLNSGLRIIRRDVIVRFLHLMPQGFSFSTTSTFAILKSRYSLYYIPITVEKRIGKSTVRQLKHGPQTIMLMLRLSVLFEPLRIFLTITAYLGLMTLISLGIDVLSHRASGIGDTTILLAVATMLVFLFGLLCDQISALRREHHNH